MNLRERVFPRLEEETSSTYQDVRIEYLSNHITKDEFYKKVSARHARMKKHTEYKQIISSYIQSVSNLEIDQFVENERTLREEVNKRILDLNYKYHCSFALVE